MLKKESSDEIEKSDSVSQILSQSKQVNSKPPQHVIDKMNRILVAAVKEGKTPAELEDDIYRKMFE
ncbi:hypothetical protein [Thiomicrorhabdus lithotrophica]|uniref:Uncharacterized protein n=1 Tax=Thiomicrorhabdus lithotrophica TaxID=2949997 RepID=A0ABY8CC93_9GAMM|nr:hypothetical protein [Thiomicrorhabdus lithotrophica]WEJ62837.1 hypothetical protein NR989_00925 [Thiomicrorhabdus lithotrophica]